MRKIMLSFLALSLYVFGNAQFSVAIVGGPQMNSTNPPFSVRPDTTGYTQTKHTGLNFGFVAHVPMNKMQTLCFRTGVLYSAKGSQVFQRFDTAKADLLRGDHYLTGNTILKVNYIDIPVNFLLKLPMKGKTKFLLGGGVQGSLFYNGSTDFSGPRVYKPHKDSNARTEFKQAINKDLPVGNGSNKFQPLHFSANGLTGFEFGRVFINVTYSHGLTGFFKSEDDSYKHKTLGFHFGIFLGNPQKPDANIIKDKDNDGIADELDACPDLAGTAITNGCPDRDSDGIADKDDLCPAEAGTLQNKGCPVRDRDGDGIKDEEDECPDQAGLAQNKGCPVFDRDKDGISDAEDKCPEIAGVKKYNGCPVPDTDGDGVNDDDDKCPAVAGAKDNFGCPKVTVEQQQKVSYAAKRIQFEFKKAELSPSSYKVLDEIANILKTNPTLSIRVEGHTSGPDSESNQILSQKRADSVKEYFISKGIEANRIMARGFGSAKPISKNGNKEENPIDRRVEMIIF